MANQQERFIAQIEDGDTRELVSHVWHDHGVLCESYAEYTLPELEEEHDQRHANGEGHTSWSRNTVRRP